MVALFVLHGTFIILNNQGALEFHHFLNEKTNGKNVHWSPVHLALKIATHFLMFKLPPLPLDILPTHHFKGKLFS